MRGTPPEGILLIFIILVSFSSLIIFLFYKRFKEGSLEYSKAKSILEDVIFSFKGDLQRQEKRVQVIDEKIEKLINDNFKIREEINSEIMSMKARLEESIRSKEDFADGYEELKKKFEDLTSQQNELWKKIADLESSEKGYEVSERGIGSVISIGKEKALAPLTETEIKILELLANEGEMTGPQVKVKIKLTREHTARLLKSLYARGYIERKTDKIPFVYQIKNEMKDILKRQKPQI